MTVAQEQALKRELRRKKDPISQGALALIEELEERVAIKFEGRVLVDGEELARELFLLSAYAGNLNGPQAVEKCMKLLTEAKRIL